MQNIAADGTFAFDNRVVRALVFDVQGTLLDFFQPMLRMGDAANRAKGVALDWVVLAARWRESYRRSMDEINAGSAPWRGVDRIYRDSLDELLDDAGCGDRFSAVDKDAMNEVWVRLDPWPDSASGLARLRRRFITAALTNAGMPAAVAAAKHAGLSFDAVLSAELAGAYKPAPAVYRFALDCLGVTPEAAMMVACHPYDLRAAKACGMRTAFVARPLEFGAPRPAAPTTAVDDPAFDLAARDLHHLADLLDPSR